MDWTSCCKAPAGALIGKLCGLSLTIFALPSCISVLDNAQESPVQSIEVIALSATGDPRSGLKCTISNDKGHWTLEVPGTVVVKRSAEALHFECDDSAEGRLPELSQGAIDERDARAARAAKRYGTIGAGAGAGLLGSVAMGPAGLVYMATGGAGMGGYMAWEKRRADTTSGLGFRYPNRIELRFEYP